MAASAAAQGQRSGKFRHVYGDAAKTDGEYQEIKNPFTSGESSFVSANDKFIAVAKSSGGGPVYIIPINKPGRLPANCPMLAVQKGKVLDTDFHPFRSNMIATASEDCSVAVTQFPKDGLTESILKADVMLKGHGKKVALTKFNPCANAILASGSFDRTVKLWNIETEENIMTYSEIKDNIYSLAWNYDGSQLAMTGKDKKLRIFDPRSPDEASCVESFQGLKSSKVFWMQNLGWIGSTGFSKSARRQLRFWDLKDMSKPIFSAEIDQVSSILVPHYDNDLGILYMNGKGDGSVQISEVVNDSRKFYPLSAYRHPEPQKGGGWMAKRSCNVWKAEVGRFFRLLRTKIVPVSFICPRKSAADVFQDDIYPDCFAGKAALTSDEWLDGQNKAPITRSMNPENESKEDDDDDGEYKKKKTYKELEAENKELVQQVEDLTNKVKELEAQLGGGGGDDGGGNDDGGDDAGGDDDDGGD